MVVRFWEKSVRKDTGIWILLCLVVGILIALYLSSTPGSGRHAPIMPLDDTYIHFQYARQMATGHPFTYNTGDDPTSGGTSLLYVPLLAVGYASGFKGLSLAEWALGIGVLSFVLSAWLIYLSIRAAGGSRLIGVLVMLTFAVNGAFVWTALSGMETMLFVCSVLLCLYAYQKEWQQRAAWAGVLVALVRPEGAFVAGTLAVALAWRAWQGRRRIPIWAAFPILAAGVQPLLNLALTGTWVATGALAKSQFYDVTVPFGEQVHRVFDFWVRLWREFLQGRAAYGDPYIPGLVILLSLIMVLVGANKSRKKFVIHPALLAGVWMLLMSVSVSTLETAFWHYKRYQLPIMALTLPLAGWLLTALAQRRRGAWASGALAGIALLISLHTNLMFVALYRNNVLVTTHLQYTMAEWIKTNLPPDARVGVFDVGIVSYIGDRRTYDVVGLTTPGTAEAMREGPGAVYDTMADYPDRPDYFALYRTPRHPSTIYLMRTSTWSCELARFEAPDVPNTTSAGPLQIVAQADWSGVDAAARVHQPVTLTSLTGLRQMGMLDVGDLVGEQDYGYTWSNHATIPGFLTSLDSLPYYACAAEPCSITDGTRAINGEERFALPHVGDDETLVVVLRVHAAESARLTYGCGKPQGVRVVPEIPGNWVEIVFPLSGNTRDFCVKASGTYYPARYWIYAGHFAPEPSVATPLATWDKLSLLDYTVQQRADQLTLDTRWAAQGGAQGDGKLFVHLYRDPDQQPVSQWDGYLETVVPLANLLPGDFQQQVQLPLVGVPPGDYLLSLGFYDRASGQRYPVQAARTDAAGERVFLTTITIHP